jgi:hypothetical protein
LDKLCGKIEQDKEILKRDYPLIECKQAATSQIHLFCTQFYDKYYFPNETFFLNPKTRLKTKIPTVLPSSIQSQIAQDENSVAIVQNEENSIKPLTPNTEEQENSKKNETLFKIVKQIQEDKENIKKNVNYVLAKRDAKQTQLFAKETSMLQEYSSILKKFKFTKPGETLNNTKLIKTTSSQQNLKNKNVILRLTNKSKSLIDEDASDSLDQQLTSPFFLENNQTIKMNSFSDRRRPKSSSRLISSKSFKSDSSSSTGDSNKSSRKQTLTEILAIKNSVSQKQTKENPAKILRSKSSVCSEPSVKYLFYSSNSKVYDKNSYFIYYPENDSTNVQKVAKPSLAQLQSTLTRANTMYNMPNLNNGYRTLIGESKDILDSMQINGKQLKPCNENNNNQYNSRFKIASGITKMISTHVNK